MSQEFRLYQGQDLLHFEAFDDCDVVLVTLYEGKEASPIEPMTHAEARTVYARLRVLGWVKESEVQGCMPITTVI